MLRTAPDLRYTDRDVREDPELKEIAVAYLDTYGGEFDPLVRAQNMIEMDGDLTTLMTRTVLNCMRNDERVASRMPEPRGYTMPRRPKVVEEPEIHSLWIRGEKFRIKKDFVVNLHRQAKYFHKISHRETEAVYYPPQWDPPRYRRDQELPNSFRLAVLRGVCGKSLRLNWNNLEFVDLSEALKVQEWCPRCLHGHRDAGWKP